ncbi:hypothetical protein SSS_06244 [Sarcoptes scabiei]|uniref:Uncharacterized protein n=1 Tax=Sarcoptes scabiei TaxID=52283 RepID=A0A834VFQ4_SARSC|nr:hypothetical protein SSS_06244 [Sarcoptes scabiei]
MMFAWNLMKKSIHQNRYKNWIHSIQIRFLFTIFLFMLTISSNARSVLSVNNFDSDRNDNGTDLLEIEKAKFFLTKFSLSNNDSILSDTNTTTTMNSVIESFDSFVKQIDKDREKFLPKDSLKIVIGSDLILDQNLFKLDEDDDDDDELNEKNFDQNHRICLEQCFRSYRNEIWRAKSRQQIDLYYDTIMESNRFENQTEENLFVLQKQNFTSDKNFQQQSLYPHTKIYSISHRKNHRVSNDENQCFINHTGYLNHPFYCNHQPINLDRN